jgi:hypothetical protein
MQQAILGIENKKLVFYEQKLLFNIFLFKFLPICFINLTEIFYFFYSKKSREIDSSCELNFSGSLIHSLEVVIDSVVQHSLDVISGNGYCMRFSCGLLMVNDWPDPK